MIVIPAFLEKNSTIIIDRLHDLHRIAKWIQIDVTDDTMTDGSTCDLYDLVGEVDDFDVEVHLMTTNPEEYFDACAAIYARRVYFHLGEVESPSRVLSAMDPYDFTKGIVLSPQTRVEEVFAYIDDIDAVQIMTVIPGQQGGDFLPEMLEKVSYLRERRTDLWISVDGGVNKETIPAIKIRGVDAVGVGSALIRAHDIVDMYHDLEYSANTQ